MNMERFNIRAFKKDKKVKHFVTWRTNNIIAFFLSVKRSGVKYNNDILLVILSYLTFNDITHPDVKDIKESSNYIRYCKSPYVISKINNYTILKHLKVIIDNDLHELIFKDIDFVRLFLTNTKRYNYLNYINKSIFKDRNNVLKLIPIFPKIYLFDYISEELKFDRGIIFKILTYRQYSEKYLRAIFSKYGNNKEMVEEILKRRPELYPKASRSYRRDKELLLMCVTKYPINMKYIPEKYRHDFDLLRKIYKINKDCGVFMSSNLDFIKRGSSKLI